MPRLPRIYFAGALYYVTAESDHNKELFADVADYQEYLNLLKKYKAQYQFKLFSFLLMPGKVYLLIEPVPGTTISEIMHDINSSFTKYFNARYQRRGHVFRGRFRASLIEKETHLVKLTRFIHLIPKKAHLPEQPEAYAWSSYSVYVSGLKVISHKSGVEVDVEEVLENFALDFRKARGMYKEFVESAKDNEIALLGKKLQQMTFVGSREFVKKVKDRYIVKREIAQAQKPQDLTATANYPQGAGMRKKVVVLISIILLFFCGLNGYLLRGNLQLKKSIKQAVILKEAEKELEFSQRLVVARDSLKRDLIEKYHADMVSYQAMAKRLEIERKKAKNLNKGDSL